MIILRLPGWKDVSVKISPLLVGAQAKLRGPAGESIYIFEISGIVDDGYLAELGEFTASSATVYSFVGEIRHGVQTRTN